MRNSFDALRLCALVAAGAASGYLWRAAFESSTPEVRAAATPRVVHPAPAPKVVRIPPSRLAPQKTVAHHVAQRSHHVTPASTVLASHPVAAAPVQPAPTPASSTPQPSPPKPSPPKPSPPKPSPPQPKPKPKPKPAPSPTPPPAPVTSPAAPTQGTPTVQASAPPPAEPSQPTNEPNLGNSTNDTRPGWGKGDKNHTHSGPGNNP